MELEKIRRCSPKWSELVIQALINAMENKQIQVGDMLPAERDLSEMLGVSRAAIRESLTVFEFLGIVEKQGNRRVMVRGPECLKKICTTIQIQPKILNRVP